MSGHGRTEGSPRGSRVRRRRALVAGAVVALAAVLALAFAIGTLFRGGEPEPTRSPTPSATPSPTRSPTPTPTPRPTPSETPTPAPVPAFDLSARSLDDPASVWVVVNKLKPLQPADHVPADLVQPNVPHTNVPQLRQEAATALETMFAAAAAEAGLQLASNSAYRPYTVQQRLYAEDVAQNGQAAADVSTARPGHSEHQTGLAVDIGPASGACSLDACLADTAEGQWLAANAWRFGFLLRYPADKTEITGYAFEPWHYRYIGTDLATEMQRTGARTLEEFFGLPAAPAY